jgi:hypothetical protein
MPHGAGLKYRTVRGEPAVERVAALCAHEALGVIEGAPRIKPVCTVQSDIDIDRSPDHCCDH